LANPLFDLAQEPLLVHQVSVVVVGFAHHRIPVQLVAAQRDRSRITYPARQGNSFRSAARSRRMATENTGVLPPTFP
jgi:hypothetical protein